METNGGAAQEKDTLGKGYILIVDDIEFDRGIVREIFRGQYAALEAASGTEAIALLEKYADQIIMVFLDIYMPVADGFQVLEYMKAKDMIKCTPVIMVTGDCSEEVREAGYGYGVCEVLGKPFMPSELERRVSALMGMYGQKRRLEERIREQARELQKLRRDMGCESDPVE